MQCMTFLNLQLKKKEAQVTIHPGITIFLFHPQVSIDMSDFIMAQPAALRNVCELNTLSLVPQDKEENPTGILLIPILLYSEYKLPKHKGLLSTPFDVM